MNLVLEAIAEAENIEPTEEAIDEEISTLAEKYGMEKRRSSCCTWRYERT